MKQTKIDIDVECLTCGKRWETPNAMLVGKQHHLRLGHSVRAVQTMTVEWGSNGTRNREGLVDGCKIRSSK